MIRRGESGRRRPLNLPRSADEAKAFAKHGTDQALLLAGVAHRPTRGIDPAGERRFRHGSPAPYRRKQVVPAYDPVSVADQKYEKIEHLRFYRQQSRSATELPSIRVEGIIFEQKQQVSALSKRPTSRCIENLPHSQRREKSRRSQAKINAASKHIGHADGILH